MTESETIELREYIEALFREKERALDMAAAERDRAAEVLRDEQRRALLVAEAEREKAAAALRAGTDRAIADNYSRLREQIEASAKLLSSLIRASEDKFSAIQIAQGQAVQKAEEAQKRVNATQDEFRGANADVLATAMPRKEVEALFSEQLRVNTELREALGEVRTSLAVGPAELAPLQTEVTRAGGVRQGKSSSLADSRSQVALVLAALAVIASIVTHFLPG